MAYSGCISIKQEVKAELEKVKYSNFQRSLSDTVRLLIDFYNKKNKKKK